MDSVKRSRFTFEVGFSFIKMELLKNNSNEMATVVETFLIEETIGLIYDADQLDNWNKKVEELGLTGQTKIVKKDKSPIPFMHIKQNLKQVLETLCPRKVEVKDYDVTPIPIEILDLVSLSFNEGYFDKVQIWYDDKNPDPCCIGLKGDWYSYKANKQLDVSFKTREEAELKSIENGFDGAYFIEWNATAYLLGKWADVKHSFEQLTQMATKRYIQEKSFEFKEAITKAQRGLDDLEVEAFKKFGSDVSGHDLQRDLPF